MTNNQAEIRRQAEKLKLLEAREKLRLELPHLHGFPFYPWALEFMRSTNRMKFLVAGNQVSKALDDQTLIPSPKGYLKMGDIKVGDYVYGQNGKPTKIIAIPFKGKDDCYRITFDDGSSVVASGKHDWIVKSPTERFRKTYTSNFKGQKGQTWDNPSYSKWVVRDTEAIIKQGNYSPSAKPPRRFSIPLSSAVERPEKDLFDPYLMGLLLGDGGFTSKSVILTTADKETADYITEFHGARPNGRYGYRLNGYQAFLRKYKLMGLGSADKFIPEDYLNGSANQRLAVLQGLLDTDGTITKTAVIIYSSCSEKLALGVGELVTSLGGKYKIVKRKSGYRKNGVYIPCKDSYQVQIRIDVCPFRLARKAAKFRLTGVGYERVIYEIASLGRRDCTCITVDNEDGSFLATKDHIVTHNSSTLIRHAIDLATDKSKWKEFFPGREPMTFWYVYPDEAKVEEEFEAKWLREFLPRGAMKDDPVYGWTTSMTKGKRTIQFNSGVNIIFKTWKTDLQSGTVDAIFVDEELPSKIYPELAMRLIRYKGMFAMAFTATLNQDFWFRTIEMRGKPQELFPEAFKLQVSMEHDCKVYADGSPSPWTPEEIARVKASCGSQTEIDRRVHGRFVTEVGVKYTAFSRIKNMKPPTPTPSNWHYYSGVDIGSGGKNHPAAISIVAVDPSYQKAKLVRFWKGNDKEETTNDDILKKYTELTFDIPVFFGEYYDHRSRDFYLLAERHGFNFEKANKDRGEDMLNVLFKNEMLDIEYGPHTDELAIEFQTLRVDEHKTSAKDDGIDSLRYCTADIPWDLTAIKTARLIEMQNSNKPKETSNETHRGQIDLHAEVNEWDSDQEIEEWNDLAQGGF